MALIDEVRRLLSEQDSFAAIVAIAGDDPDSARSAASFEEVASDLYWKHKDLPGSVSIARAGVQFGLMRSTEFDLTDRPRAVALRSTAKAIAYNLASFTWPRWDEVGIVVGEPERVAGVEAAKVNRRLALELDKGDLARSRAAWMLAGHRLAEGDRIAASELYAEAERFAVSAQSRPDELLAQAFGCLVKLLDAPGSSDAERRVSDACAALRAAGGDGEPFAQQVETARRVFAR